MSFQPQFKLSIPKPCHEDWELMSISEKGRFCSSCSKVVMDLTGKTEQEIISIVSKSSGKVCARVTSDKVDNNYSLKRSNSFFVQRFLAAVIIAFGSFLFSLNADAKVSLEKIKDELKFSNDSVAIKKDSGIVVIKGTVTDANTQDSIPFAIVRIKVGDSTLFSTSADLNGFFKFRFEKKDLKMVDVEVVNVGYMKFVMKGIELKEGKTHYTVINLRTSLGCTVSNIQGLLVINYVQHDDSSFGQFDNAPSGRTISGKDYRSMPK